MKTKAALIAFFLLYTIFINNSTQIFAADKISSAPIDMSAGEYDADSIESAHFDENGSPVVVAESAVVMDAKTGVVIYGKNERALCYPASITKVLTALIACEETEPDDMVTFSEEAVYGIGEGSSSIAVRVGETLNMDQCMHAILLASANDVCVGVSEFISGTQEEFANKMNERAKALGAANSHFANAHGYHDPNHYTTAYDMALILKEAIKNKKFAECYGAETYDIAPTNIVDETRHLENRSKILRTGSPYYYPYIKGSKTGFTDQAGNTLISYAEKDGIGLICCVMADIGFNTYTDTSLLFDYGFSRYAERVLAQEGELGLLLPVYQEYKDKTIDLGFVRAAVKDGYTAVLPDVINKDTITIDYDVPDKIIGGINEGDPIGSANILCEGNLIASLEVEAASTIAPIPEEELIKQEMSEKLVRILLISGGVLFIILLVTIAYSIFGNPKLRRHRKKYKKQRKYFREQRKLRQQGEEARRKEQSSPEVFESHEHEEKSGDSEEVFVDGADLGE